MTELKAVDNTEPDKDSILSVVRLALEAKLAGPMQHRLGTKAVEITERIGEAEITYRIEL